MSNFIHCKEPAASGTITDLNEVVSITKRYSKGEYRIVFNLSTGNLETRWSFGDEKELRDKYFEKLKGQFSVGIYL